MFNGNKNNYNNINLIQFIYRQQQYIEKQLGAEFD